MYFQDQWTELFLPQFQRLLKDLREKDTKKDSKMQVKWKEKKTEPKHLTFTDLAVNDTFKIMSGDAVYVKVKRRHTSSPDFYMLELATGFLFGPTGSYVERVKVEVNIDADKPQIYQKF